MPALSRVTQRLFGSNAGVNQVAQFGSLAAGSPAFTTNPATIQALDEFTDGWFSAVLGVYNPTIEDMNALFVLAFRQIAYVLERGIPAWDSGTTYFIGDIVSSGNVGETFVSLADNNTNNAVTDTTKWKRLNGGGNIVAINPAVTPTPTITTADAGTIYNVNTANGAVTFTLPATPPADFSFSIKDAGGYASQNLIILVASGIVDFEAFASGVLPSSFTCRADFGYWTFFTDGFVWYIR